MDRQRKRWYHTQIAKVADEMGRIGYNLFDDDPRGATASEFNTIMGALGRMKQKIDRLPVTTRR